MKVRPRHSAGQLVLVMDRVYRSGMTTMSGGNLSVLDQNGDIWITPAGGDKGALTCDGICRVTPEGQVYGARRPSSELPFHMAVYRRRPDLRAVLHAHPPALVAFSAARVLPDTKLAAGVFRVLGDITLAAYAPPGSQALGDNIAAAFGSGFDAVVMENHGAAVGAGDPFQAFVKLEALAYTAELEILARGLGVPKSLTERQCNDIRLPMESFAPGPYGPGEREARRDMIKMIRRCCCRGLFGGTRGVCSARLSDGGFLITPCGLDRADLEEADLVRVRDGKREQGKTPARSADLHRRVYEKHAGIHAILGARPRHAMAFAVTGAPLETRIIPESHMVLGDILRVPFGLAYDRVADMFSDRTKVLLCENSQILAAGGSLPDALDRLEVAEATARAVIAARNIAPLTVVPGT